MIAILDAQLYGGFVRRGSWRVLGAAAVGAALWAAGALLAWSQPANASGGAPTAAEYPPTPDSLPQAGVPAGATFKFVFDRSTIFPGTTREITVYVPASYTADKPACVYIGLDGLAFEAPTVFDNLITKHDIPVLIAVGIAPGTVPSRDAPEDPRFDRSAEFDDLSDQLARFVLIDVLPEVERHKTPGGLAIRLSADPNDRAVGGFSTGGIGAFTLAWQRPDAFRRVFTAIGTFVDMRGGDRYPAIVRRTEPQPIKVFMQDGSNDQLTEVLGEIGDWWLGNQTLYSALRFSGYDVDHVWGEGGHSPKHATQVFPDAMRWLWKGWPQPVAAGESQNVFLKQILLPGERWERVTDAARDSRARGPATTGFQTGGPAGRVYKTLSAAGQLWLTAPNGRRQLLDDGLKGPTGVALSPDGLWLAVAESQTHWGYNYRVAADGTVRDKQRYYEFERAGEEDASGAAAWVMDRDGRLYGATPVGVQVFDRNGRVRAVLPLPLTRIADLHFGGENLEYLYVTGSGQRGESARSSASGRGSVSGSSASNSDARDASDAGRARDAKGAVESAVTYRRKLNVSGVLPDSPPIRLPPWGPG